MYPLLISGVTSIASKLIDTYNQAADRKVATEQVKFDAMLNRLIRSASPEAAAASGALTSGAVNNTNAASERLLNSPEVRAAVDAADPSKPLSLNISEDGKVTLQSGNSEPRQIQLSPETLNAARQVGAALAGRAASSSILQSVNAANTLSAGNSGTLVLRS